jgi:outer membrane lipopolysaccharide assembly protein LptE/RlpB
MNYYNNMKMKRILNLLLIAFVITFSSCGYHLCPTYTKNDKQSPETEQKLEAMEAATCPS